MNDWPYHEYLFFKLDRAFYQLARDEQSELKTGLRDFINAQSEVRLVTYATLGFGPSSTFMLWARSHKPEHIQNMVNQLLHIPMARYLSISATLFGLIRPSQYSREPANHKQVIQPDERLPYLIIYPFTKTPQWHVLPAEDRGRMMNKHIGIGKSFPAIRQCLLYGYGVESHEFIVSYETPTLDEFQELVMELRKTEARLYTENDLPVYTCIYKPPAELANWL